VERDVRGRWILDRCVNIRFMSWIDERIAQQEKLDAYKSAVASGAEGIFEDLWNEIVAQIKEAESKGLQVGTRGEPDERIVWASNLRKSGNPRELKIRLHKERGEI